MNSKKVLIISHNPLSRVNNNGKTLVSLFEGMPHDHIYQLYLNADTPDYSSDCHYVQLNEQQILRSLVGRGNGCCQEVTPTVDKVSSATIKTSSFGIHTKRLAREGIWKTGVWKSALSEWLEGKSFDVVFCMVGDGLFAYDIYRFVMKHTTAKGCLFFTDDYILGTTSRSPVALLRRRLLKRKIRKTMPLTDELYVISDEMKDAYRALFHKDGYVVRNFSVEKAAQTEVQDVTDAPASLNMVYAGGLHYNRWKVLAQIARELAKLNRTADTPCQLNVYSSQHISDDIISQMTADGACTFCGAASADQIARIYARADILLHVESSDKKAVASTKYSFSTKIPEYLSAGKCVLAVGPSEVASIRYLSDVACVACDDASLWQALNDLQSDEYRRAVRLRCEERYERDFSPARQQECLSQILSLS